MLLKAPCELTDSINLLKEHIELKLLSTTQWCACVRLNVYKDVVLIRIGIESIDHEPISLISVQKMWHCGNNRRI